MAQELELKLVVNDSGADLVGALSEIIPSLFLEPKPLINVYFDTENLELNRHKIALRIRKKGERFIQTMKTKGIAVNGLHQRGEWEWDLESDVLNVELLNNCEEWPKDIETSLLYPVFETNFVRQEGIVNWQGSKIELAVDQGDVISGEFACKINEIELELIEGEPESIIHLGQLIQNKLSVEQCDVSKAERGYELFKRGESKA